MYLNVRNSIPDNFNEKRLFSTKSVRKYLALNDMNIIWVARLYSHIFRDKVELCFWLGQQVNVLRIVMETCTPMAAATMPECNFLQVSFERSQRSERNKRNKKPRKVSQTQTPWMIKILLVNGTVGCKVTRTADHYTQIHDTEWMICVSMQYFAHDWWQFFKRPSIWYNVHARWSIQAFVCSIWKSLE